MDENHSKTSIINSVQDHGPSVPKTDPIEREMALFWSQIKHQKADKLVSVKLDRRNCQVCKTKPGIASTTL